jgi:hypothetical protein
MHQTTTAPPLAWSRAFPAVPAQVREARQFLSAILDGRPAAADAILCLSELVTNASVHSRSREPGGHFRVRIQLHGSHLRLEVSDEGGPWTQPDTTDERTAAAYSSSTNWPAAGDAPGMTRPGGRSGLRWSARERRPGHRLGTAQHPVRQTNLAAYLPTRRSPAPAVTSPARPLPSRTGRSSRHQPYHRRPPRTPAPCPLPRLDPRPPRQSHRREPRYHDSPESQ